MLNKKNHITQLFFGTGYLNFAHAISQDHLYKADLLREKLKQHLFYYKVKAEVFPSYNFGSLVFNVVDNFHARLSLIRHGYYEQDFLKDEEKFLRNNVYRYTIFGQCFPQTLRDFWVYYPKYEVPFDNVECIYLDFGCELPKVIDSLLSELLLRDVPLREKIPANPFEIAISSIAATIMTKDVLPPILDKNFTEEVLSNHIVEYLSGEDEEKIFLKVISFYLNSRPNLKNECTEILKLKGLSFDDESLVRYFLGEHIFQGVSNEAKRFFVANANLKEKNSFKADRASELAIGKGYSEEYRQGIITRAQKSLERMTEHFAFLNSLTLEEKAERQRQAEREADAVDFSSLPRVSLSKLVEMGEEKSDTDKGLN